MKKAAILLLLSIVFVGCNNKAERKPVPDSTIVPPPAPTDTIVPTASVVPTPA